MSSKTKKPIYIGTIYGIDVFKTSPKPYKKSFRTGTHMSRKDRPRDKNWKRWL